MLVRQEDTGGDSKSEPSRKAMRTTTHVPSRRSMFHALWLYGPILLLLIVVAFVSARLGVSPGYFTRDPSALTGANPFWGAVSNVGILLWCACATLCFYVSWLARRSGATGEWTSFFLSAGILTTILLLDDLFLLHEVVFPGWLGIRERYVILTYGLAATYGVVRYRHIILATNYWILALAAGFFAVSLSVDYLTGHGEADLFLFEDGLKLLGIATWGAYRLSWYQNFWRDD